MINYMPNASSQDNWLLARLDPEARARVEKSMVWVELARGARLYRSGCSESHIYFPTTATVSIKCSLADGATAEVGSVGREGLLGMEALMGDGRSPREAEVSAEGFACKISSQELRKEFERAGRLHELVLAYALACGASSAQSSACNRFHSIGQQLSCWLLGALDRGNIMAVKATHESVAEALGVRRESVSTAAAELRKAGAIAYSRGLVQVLNREKLEKGACECYEVNKREFWRLVGRPGLDQAALNQKLA